MADFDIDVLVLGEHEVFRRSFTQIEALEDPAQLVPPRPCGRARSGLKIGGGCPLTPFSLWSQRPSTSRARSSALWALPCCFEHED